MKTPNRRRGVTLFEALLAAALTAVVVGLISTALSFYLKSVDERRQSVGEAQLARALLRRIANDLRAAIDFEPIDLSSAQQAAGAGSLPGGGPGEGEGDPLGEGGEIEETEEELTELLEATLPTSELGLYGTLNELQVDISRTPRMGEYELAEATGEYDRMLEILSDVKTVAYYMSDSATAVTNLAVATVGMDDSLQQSGATGLVRQTTSRDSAQFALANGGIAYGTSELLAPEVVALEFAYFDGVEWLPEWDSAELGSLPTAVSITLAIDSLNGQSQDEPGEPKLYRLVVHLPASEIGGSTTTEEELLEEETVEAEGGV